MRPENLLFVASVLLYYVHCALRLKLEEYSKVHRCSLECLVRHLALYYNYTCEWTARVPDRLVDILFQSYIYMPFLTTVRCTVQLPICISLALYAQIMPVIKLAIYFSELLNYCSVFFLAELLYSASSTTQAHTSPSTSCLSFYVIIDTYKLIRFPITL